MSLGIALAEHGLLPDRLVRAGIRGRLRRHLRRIERDSEAERSELLRDLITEMDRGPIAPAPSAANRQHYEVPTDFFRLVLGARLKYSCAFWPAGTPDLDAAEVAMLERTRQHAGIEDGMTVLDLGCGWGSLSLWLAERLPRSRILAVSGSRTQQAWVEERARRLGLANLSFDLADVGDYDPGERFDRIVSVELFEHLRNYRELLRRLAGWLAPRGRALVHIFCHRRWPYLYEAGDGSGWIERHFFSGGLMPCDDLLYRFDDDLAVEHHWHFSGEHYERTARAWLRRLDAAREPALAAFRATHDSREARRRLLRWRLFFLACETQFGLHGGQEWWVSHYLLRPAV